MPLVSVIIPTLNESPAIAETLCDLQPARGDWLEIIVVDGGSSDDTAERVKPLADNVLIAPAGRARQMNAGAVEAGGDYLWFLHADTRLSTPAVLDELAAALLKGAAWGRFDVRLSGSGIMFRVIAFFMNRRSRLTGIATGDQGIFVRRAVFQEIGGFPDQPLMEDIELSSRLKRRAGPVCLRGPLVTSSRRWRQNGVWRTIWLMWSLRWAYWRGASPDVLHRRYASGGKP